MPHFTRYIGIDYSGAETADSSCKGLRAFVAEGSGEPKQVQPPPSPRRYWTRRGLAEWLREELDRNIPTIVGIDHAVLGRTQVLHMVGLEFSGPGKTAEERSVGVLRWRDDKRQVIFN